MGKLNMKYQMNKKGIAQMGIFLIFIVVLLIFMFSMGGISSLILKNTFEKIPVWFWVGLVFFILIIVRRKKK